MSLQRPSAPPLKALRRSLQSATMPIVPSRPRLSINDAGRVSAALPAEPFEDEMFLERGFGALLCTELSVLGARTVQTESGHLALITLKERGRSSVEFWAGAAHRPDAAEALGDAATDALLRDWHDSVLVAGAARLVAESTCRAAMVLDDAGVTTYGPATEFPPLGARGMEPEAGDRLAARTTRGEFRALSLGGASVMLNVAPGAQNTRRIDVWFHALEAALVEAS